MPKRKPTRLAEYDYSTPGAYFVIMCTRQAIDIIIGAGDAVPYTYFLNCPGNVILSVSEESLLIGEVSAQFMRSFTTFRMTDKFNISVNGICTTDNTIPMKTQKKS